MVIKISKLICFCILFMEAIDFSYEMDLSFTCSDSEYSGFTDFFEINRKANSSYPRTVLSNNALFFHQ